MKKLLVVAIGRVFSSKSTSSALLPVLALGLGLAFWTATAAPPGSSPVGGGSSTSPAGGGHQPCVVCHNVQHNPITLTIDCNALQAHLDHGDYEGPCRQAT